MEGPLYFSCEAWLGNIISCESWFEIYLWFVIKDGKIFHVHLTKFFIQMSPLKEKLNLTWLVNHFGLCDEFPWSYFTVWKRGRSDRPVLQLRWRLNKRTKLGGIKSFINRLEEVEILVCELVFLFYVKIDCLKFHRMWNNFNYLWHVKMPNIFMWLSFTRDPPLCILVHNFLHHDSMHT